MLRMTAAPTAVPKSMSRPTVVSAATSPASTTAVHASKPASVNTYANYYLVSANDPMCGHSQQMERLKRLLGTDRIAIVSFT